jgi:hypothetical protein
MRSVSQHYQRLQAAQHVAENVSILHQIEIGI